MTKKMQDKAPRSCKRRNKKFVKKGLILVFTGGGKGKTTAALGTAFRALGRGWNVAMVQFIKGVWKTGEAEAAKKFGERFKLYSMGEGFTWDTQNFERDVQKAEEAWEKCRGLLHDQEHSLVIFDEIIYALKYQFLDENKVIAELKKKPPLKHVLLTGGGASRKLIKIADLVTEMKCLKHPFQQGILAQPGIDY